MMTTGDSFVYVIPRGRPTQKTLSVRKIVLCDGHGTFRGLKDGLRTQLRRKSQR